jgi:hypothetical protein
MFAELQADLPKKNKEGTATHELDGSVDFTIYVMNTSAVQAGRGVILLRICQECTFAKEPVRFTKIVGGADTDREFDIEGLPAGFAVTIPLNVKAPQNANGFGLDVWSRCINCEVRPMDKLTVHY